jgi:cytochrome bd-type quinol oxidase subunit 2
MVGLVTRLADATTSINQGVTAACSGSCNNTSVNAIFAGVANALVFLVGAVSVIMIILGGLKYVTSNGDSKQTESAKNTILYAVVGLVVAMASFAIITFVTKNIGK